MEPLELDPHPSEDAEPSSCSPGCLGVWGGTVHIVSVQRGLLSLGMVGSGRSPWWRCSTRGTLDMGAPGPGEGGEGVNGCGYSLPANYGKWTKQF